MGKTVALTATVSPSNATDKTVTFKSADETLATVDNNGVVTGVKATEPGIPVVITVTTNDGNKTDTCLVTVTAPTVGAKAYSNSLDFGDYDYSGRPNLAPNLDFSKFSGNTKILTEPLACFKDHETYLELDSGDPSAVNTSRNIYVPNCSALLPNNTYIMTVPMMINADFDNFTTSFIARANDGTALGTVNPPRGNVGTWQNVTKVFTVANNLKFDNSYLQLWQPKEGNGKLYIGYDIKIEKVNSTSDTPTPYQHNLLVDPY